MTAPGAATYEIHEGAEEFAQLQPVWETLEIAGADHFFQTHAYLRLWQRTIGVPTGARPLLIVMREGDRVVGIFPACRVRESGLPMVSWLGGPQALDYGDVLFDAETAKTPIDDFIAESLRLLSRKSRGAVLYLPNVREDARAIAPLRSRLRVFRESAAPYVPIVGTWEDYMAARGSSLRRHVRRAQRMLDGLGEVEYGLLHSDDPDIMPAVGRLVEFKRARYDAPGTRTNLFDEHYVRFRTEQATKDRHSIVETLRLDGEVIAAKLNVIFRNRSYAILSGFDEKYAAMSPGLLIESFGVRMCFENGWDPCDFCWGNEEHKYLWADRDAKLTTFVGDDAKGALFSAAAAARRGVAEIRGGLRTKPNGTGGT